MLHNNPRKFDVFLLIYPLPKILLVNKNNVDEHIFLNLFLYFRPQVYSIGLILISDL